MINVLKSLRLSRPLSLAFSIMLLTMSVLFAADAMDLRDDQRRSLIDARKMMAEAIAVQIATVASTSDAKGIRSIVSSLATRNPDIKAISLKNVSGRSIAEYGDQNKIDSEIESSTLNQMHVPILDSNRIWGSLYIAFTPVNTLAIQIRYFGGVMVGCLFLYLLFLRKALVQLDPSQVVPGRVNTAFNMFSEGVVILDDRLQILLINESAAQTIGKSVNQLIGNKLDDWPWQQPDDWQPPWTTVLHSGMKLSDQALHLKLNNGEIRTLVASCANVGSGQEGVHGVMVTLNDMTAIEKKNSDLAVTLQELRSSQESVTRKNRELEALATLDPLTGLVNRRALMERFEHQFTEASNNSGSLSCVMVDIDHFKSINDTHGHGVGDEVICAVASTMVAKCRDTDIVGRYGGEEFVIVLPGLSHSEAIEAAESIRSSIAILGENPSIPVDTVTASLGVNTFRSDIDSIMQMIEQADSALYLAKQNGRNRVVAYDPESVITDEDYTVDMTPAKAVASLEPAISSENQSLRNVEPFERQESRVIELENIIRQRSHDLQVLREYDRLTGIPMRTLFMQRVDQEIQRAGRLKLNIGVMSLEIKDLNRIVSTFGHKASDALVVTCVSRIQEGLRRTDMVSNILADHNMSLITTNEYGVLLSDLDDSSQAMPVITRLRRLFSKPFEIDTQKIYLGVNIGISLYPQGGKDSFKLMESACQARSDAALKPDKISHSFASTSLDKISRDYIQFETDLHESVEKGQLEVYFQPKFDLALRKVESLEALLRWRHPDKGFIPPSEFIPIAESNGLIHEISNFVMDQCLSQIVQWNSIGLTGLQVAINISPLQVRNPNLTSTILTKLNKSNLSTSQILIELTETSVFESPERAQATLHQMRNAGLSVALDDFGTGYTSLGQLADLPLDELKIDRSFVIAMGTSERSRAIVESVINMAHALKLRVVAEGVETNEQLAQLAGLGCNDIQGYLISRPLPADEVTNFLLQHNQARRSA